MRRHRLGHKASKRRFHRTAKRVRPANRAAVQRGGIRW